MELRYAEIAGVNVVRRMRRLSSPNAGQRAVNAQGFTLLEVMVAVAIMAMVLVTLLGLKNRSMQDVLVMQHMTTATMLAKRTMVEATTESKPILPAEKEGTFPEEEFKDYTWKKTIVPTPLIQIMEVRVDVLWKEGTRQETVELLSYESAN
jgi:general secretion pathway protein I